jgi:hypothetical protein
MAVRPAYDVGDGNSYCPAILVYLFKGWLFEMVKSADGGSTGEHRSLVFSGFL